MTDATPPDAVKYQNQAMWNTLTHLLALNRSTQFLANHEKNGKDAPDAMKQKTMLETMFYDTHQQLYQDTHSSAQHGELRAGTIQDPEKRIRVRDIVHNLSEELFDALPKPVAMEPEQLAQVYAKYYVQLRKEEPFAYGNELTISTFLTAVSRLPAEKEILGTYIDFRRLDENELNVFMPGNPKALDEKSISTAFLHALEKSRDAAIPNKRAKADMLTIPGDNNPQPNRLEVGEKAGVDTLMAWPDRTVEIAGVPFLGHKDENGNLYMVTITGGLVPYSEAKDAIEQGLKDNKLIDELPKFKTKAGVDPLPIFEEVINEKGEKQKKQIAFPEDGIIDGFAYDKEGAPLICLDINILTGLRPAAHNEFKKRFDEIFPKKEIFFLNDPANKKTFLEAVEKKGDARLLNICNTAVTHIERMTKQLDENVKKEVDHVPSAKEPLFVFSMGGSGSGKSVVTKYINDKTGSSKLNKNYVFTSLDDFRNRSILYRVMRAAGHHADDYVLVEPFANTMRDWVTKRAMEQGKHILYDGSAIPYARYSSTIDTARSTSIKRSDGTVVAKKQYKVDVCAADAYLDVPEKAKTAGMTDRVIERVIDRYDNPEENRSLPWGVILSKHTEAMKAFLEAANDSRIDNVLLYNVDGKMGTSYLAAYASTLEGDVKEQVKELEKLNPKSFMDILKTKKFTEDDFAKIPYFKPENIGFTLRTDNNNERLMLITDMHKMVQMAEKGLQNQHASSVETLHYRTDDLGGIIPSPNLSFVDRVIADVGSTLGRVLNYVVPSENYQKAVAAKTAASAAKTASSPGLSA